MTLPSGAHVGFKSADGVLHEFNLDERKDSISAYVFRSHYHHAFESLFTNRVNISGFPGKENIRQEIALWAYNDWAGGEGNVFFKPTQPTVYDNASSNTRIPGQLSGTPTRTDATLTPSTSTVPTDVFLINAAGLIWAVGSREIYSSSDGLTFTNRATGVGAPWLITAAAGDGKYLYVAWFNANTSTRVIHRNTISTDETFTNPANGNAGAFFGLAFLGPYLYAWGSGGNTFYFDTTAAIPQNEAPGKIQPVGVGQLASSFADIVAANQSILFFIGQAGLTTVYQYTGAPNGIMRPIWTVEKGFTGQAICHSQGNIFIAGTQGTRAAVWGMNLTTFDPIFLGFIRPTSSLSPVSIAAGLGGQLMVGMSNGEVYIIDLSLAPPAFSRLDQVPTNNLGAPALSTYKDKRVAARLDGANLTIATSTWVDDFTTVTTSWTWTSPAWDFDLPEEDKLLLGIHLVFKPFTSTETITVSYQTNEVGSYTTLPVVNAATSGASIGNVYQTISTTASTASFRLLRLQMTGTNGAILYSSTFRVTPLSFNEVWEVSLRMDADTIVQRPSNQSIDAHEKRDYFLGNGSGPKGVTGIVINKNIVTFLDGYRYPKKGDFTTHTVVVETPQDFMEQVETVGAGNVRPQAKGVLRLRLRSVVP